IVLFRDILQKNIRRYKVEKRVKIIPYALGDTDDKVVEMGTPEVNGLVHFGYTKVLSSGKEKMRNAYTVKVKKPQTLFSELTELHFIKCDIEGYEDKVIPEFTEIIEKFKPSLQIEICPKRNREIIINMLKKLDYQVYYLMDNNLHASKTWKDNLNRSCDLYFLQPSTIASMQSIIKK
ncbi:MAG TPA: FkbM family methyltransferase, partial [Gillisia sp.]|nr:FkbM family methyltransferase [Gillisia sp.]